MSRVTAYWTTCASEREPGAAHHARVSRLERCVVQRAGGQNFCAFAPAAALRIQLSNGSSNLIFEMDGLGLVDEIAFWAVQLEPKKRCTVQFEDSNPEIIHISQVRPNGKAGRTCAASAGRL